jgi:hypothetical protein
MACGFICMVTDLVVGSSGSLVIVTDCTILCCVPGQ